MLTLLGQRPLSQATNKARRLSFNIGSSMMKMMPHKCLRFFFPILLAILSGCTSTLDQHPKAIVRYPTRAGMVAGGVVLGVPASIVSLPVTFPTMLYQKHYGSWDCDMEVIILFIPAFVCAEIGGDAIGGIPWLLFGWWGDDEDKQALQPTVKTPSESGNAIERELDLFTEAEQNNKTK